MQRCGIEMNLSDDDALNADRELYALLSHEHGNEAHSRYNALLRELVSFERLLEARHRRMQNLCEDAGGPGEACSRPSFSIAFF